MMMMTIRDCDSHATYGVIYIILFWCWCWCWFDDGDDDDDDDDVPMRSNNSITSDLKSVSMSFPATGPSLF